MTQQHEFIEGLQLWNFSADEILYLGAQHEQNGLNSLPPVEFLERIVKTCYAIQVARQAYGGPIYIISGYRSPAYNSAIGGASKSLHMRFNALDCGVSYPGLLFRILMQMRDAGQFQGGLGLYPTFVHVDTRGENATWNG